MSAHILKTLFLTLFLLIGAMNCSADESPLFEKARDLYIERKTDEALPIFSQLAKQNDADGHYYLGLIYTDKQSTHYNIWLGISHLFSAINLEHAQAMFHVGMMHDNGSGFKQDAMIANDWYRRSKRAEKPTNAIITYYKEKNDTLVEVAYEELFKDLLLKAKEGDAETQFHVAAIYDDGKRVPHDFTKALYWYKEAAHNNYSHAQFMMGYFYCRGVGVERDAELADVWLALYGHGVKCTEPWD